MHYRWVLSELTHQGMTTTVYTVYTTPYILLRMVLRPPKTPAPTRAARGSPTPQTVLAPRQQSHLQPPKHGLDSHPALPALVPDHAQSPPPPLSPPRCRPDDARQWCAPASLTQLFDSTVASEQLEASWDGPVRNGMDPLADEADCWEYCSVMADVPSG